MTDPSARRRSCGCQSDGQRIAAQDHHQDQPPYRSLAVGVGADELGDVADGRGLGLDLPALGAQGGTLGLAVGYGRSLSPALLDQRLAALALCRDGRERGCGPSALSRFLDREIDLAKTPIEVADG